MDEQFEKEKQRRIGQLPAFCTVSIAEATHNIQPVWLLTVGFEKVNNEFWMPTHSTLRLTKIQRR